MTMVGMRELFVFILASSFRSLVYEAVWLRLTMATFRVTTTMVLIVLSMFMDAPGLGSWGDDGSVQSPPLLNVKRGESFMDWLQTGCSSCSSRRASISMCTEVVWIRQFTPYLGNVVYAFAIILAIHLVATSSGSIAYRWWIRSNHPQQGRFAWIGAELLGLMPLFTADPKLPIPRFSHETGFVLGAIRAAVGIIPFSARLGFLTPMIINRWSSGDPDRVGGAYAVNALGSILCPLAAGFGLLLWMGDRWALLYLATPLFLFGLIADLWRRQVVEGAQAVGRPILRYAAVLLLSVSLVGITNDYETKWNGRVVRRA
jgi:hypothetical protein